MIIIYTDGSAHPNPGPGGFAVVIVEIDNDGKEHLLDIYQKQCDNITTNNKEELKAIVWVMLNYSCNMTPIVCSDSQYCINTFTKWMFNWERNNWTTANKGTPENLDLIQTYFNYYQKGRRLDLRYVKGHNNNTWNELADKLATGKITKEEAYEKYGRFNIRQM